MNEDELKAIWKKNEDLSLNNVDFEAIKHLCLKSQKKIRRRIKWEVFFAVLLYVFFIPLVYFVIPNLFFLTPFYVGVWIWYLWEIKRIYKLESNFQDSDSFKESLQKKQKVLRGYIKRSRYQYFAIPLLFAATFIISVSFEEIFINPFGFLVALISAQILSMFIVELSFWFTYFAPLDETEDLLRQLDETQ
jgi:hypothetical protein